jgi:ferric-dicitrate binding protein FerR (iron transport regulator)
MIGHITNIHGAVTIKRLGVEKPVAAIRGAEFSIGDVLATGPGSSAQVTFSDESFADLAPGSSLRVNQYSFDPIEKRRVALVRVLTGQTRFIAYKPLSSDSALRVETEHALVSTGIVADFVVAVHDQETEVAVLANGVNVRHAAPFIIGEVNLGVNQRTIVKEKSPPAQLTVITPEQRKTYLMVFRRL